MTSTLDLDKALLMPIVQKVLVSTTFEISSFEISPLKPGVGNVTSLGVYRVVIEILHRGQVESISVVVKHLADGRPLIDTRDPAHWNHWRREIEFFQSPLVHLIPESIHFPRYLGHTLLANGSELFWNEDLGDLEKLEWSWEQCLRAAELEAELNSIRDPSIDQYPWLNRSQLEGWLELRVNFFDPLFPKVAEIARDDSALLSAFENFENYLSQPQLIIDVLRTSRQCFVHGDFNLNNLVTVSGRGGQITALDWQLCGIAAIGSEIAAIFNTARERGVIKPTRLLFDEICTFYMNRYNALNPEAAISFKEVCLAAAAMGYFILEGDGFFFHQPDPAKSGEENGASLREMLVDFAEGPLSLYATILHELL